MLRTLARTTLVPLFFAGLFLPIAQGQIEVTIRAKYDRYLQYEPLDVVVSIRNELGGPILLGSEEGSAVLAFDVEEILGEPISLADDKILKDSWQIASWKTETRTFDLLQSYPIRKQGPHRIVARVTVGGVDFRSNRLMIDILPGMEIARAAGMTESGSRRSLSLRTLVRDRHDFVFLQIQDEGEGRIYGTQNLGTILRYYKPQLRMSSDGTAHVLHQSAPTRYTHSVTTLDGRPVSTVFYSSTENTEVALVEDRRGRLKVTGVKPYQGDPMVEPVRMPKPQPQDK